MFFVGFALILDKLGVVSANIKVNFVFALNLHYVAAKSGEIRLRLNKSKVNFVFALGLHYVAAKSGEIRLRLNKSKVYFAFVFGLH